jgi:hypothetical protein
MVACVIFCGWNARVGVYGGDILSTLMIFCTGVFGNCTDVRQGLWRDEQAQQALQHLPGPIPHRVQVNRGS